GSNEKPKVKKHITSALKKLVDKYRNDEHVRKVFDEIQQKLHCCGADSPKDYGENPPTSCSKDGVQFTEGCIKKVSDLSKAH
uniref:CD63-like protein Sm-TSP-2 n=1 Tax=Schistosoma mansoni TaxID=6183 RepID=UPI0003E5C701|nr:Chain A, CD63-like protein Sm-TSP-2 [Schistosoma mansoni]